MILVLLLSLFLGIFFEVGSWIANWVYPTPDKEIVEMSSKETRLSELKRMEPDCFKYVRSWFITEYADKIIKWKDWKCYYHVDMYFGSEKDKWKKVDEIAYQVNK